MADEHIPPVVASCKTCRYWLPDMRTGVCRRNPPAFYDNQGNSGFPTAVGTAWCGEHNPL